MGGTKLPNKLNAAIATIHPNAELEFDFDRCVDLLMTFLHENKDLSKYYVSGVETGGGPGGTNHGGRCRGGQGGQSGGGGHPSRRNLGCGRGRGCGRFQGRGRGQGNGGRRGPIVQVADRYYTAEEYTTMTPNQCSELHQLCEARNNAGDRRQVGAVAFTLLTSHQQVALEILG